MADEAAKPNNTTSGSTGASTATPEAPPTSSPTSSATENATAPAGEATATPATAQPDRQKLLEDLDPDEAIRTNRKLAGKVGQLAEQLAIKKAEELRAKEREQEAADKKKADEKAERERLRKLRDNDPYAFAEADREREEAEEAAAKAEAERTAEADREARAWQSVDNMLLGFFEKLPDSIKAKLADKEYDGDPLEARLAYLNDVADALADTRLEPKVQAAITAREKELEAAIRKKVFGDANADDELDSGSGTPAAGALTQAEWNQRRGDSQWRRDNRERINEAIRSGRVRS